MSIFNNTSIPNFEGNVLPIVSEKEKKEMDKLRKEFIKNGGKVKVYGTNMDKDNYKLKGK